jgi:hypothetical protein
MMMMMMMFNYALAQMVIYHLPYSTIPGYPSPKSRSSTTNFAPETRSDQQHSTLAVRNRNFVLKCDHGACWSEDTTCSSRVPAYRPHYFIARLLGHNKSPFHTPVLFQFHMMKYPYVHTQICPLSHTQIPPPHTLYLTLEIILVTHQEIILRNRTARNGKCCT